MQKFSAYLIVDGEVHGCGCSSGPELEDDVALVSDGEVQAQGPVGFQLE